jgi:uncharacterized protein
VCSSSAKDIVLNLHTSSTHDVLFRISTLKKNISTWIGLGISYFSLTGLSFLFKTLYGSPLSDTITIARELSMLSMVGVLLWIVVKSEHLPFSSIGLHSEKWLASLGWAAVTVVVCFAVAFGIIELVRQFGWKYGDSNAFSNLSLGTITLVTIRAGVAEDVFFRGFIIERLSTMTGNRFLAAGLSLVPFALFHYSQGPAGILISFALGGVLTGMYLWRRDLKSNIIAHFLVDFIANVLPVIFSR